MPSASARRYMPQEIVFNGSADVDTSGARTHISFVTVWPWLSVNPSVLTIWMAGADSGRNEQDENSEESSHAPESFAPVAGAISLTRMRTPSTRVTLIGLPLSIQLPSATTSTRLPSICRDAGRAQDAQGDAFLSEQVQEIGRAGLECSCRRPERQAPAHAGLREKLDPDDETNAGEDDDQQGAEQPALRAEREESEDDGGKKAHPADEADDAAGQKDLGADQEEARHEQDANSSTIIRFPLKKVSASPLRQ